MASRRRRKKPAQIETISQLLIPKGFDLDAGVATWIAAKFLLKTPPKVGTIEPHHQVQTTPDLSTIAIGVGGGRFHGRGERTSTELVLEEVQRRGQASADLEPFVELAKQSRDAVAGEPAAVLNRILAAWRALGLRDLEVLDRLVEVLDGFLALQDAGRTPPADQEEEDPTEGEPQGSVGEERADGR